MTRRARPIHWLLVGVALFGAACSTDRPSSVTGVATAATLKQDEDAAGIASADLPDRPTTYAVIGDVPYEPLTPSAISVFPVLISAINQDPDVRRAIHVGDIKSGSTLCSDAWFDLIAQNFATFSDPLVYAIGDNEWTDCHRTNNGAYQPLERLRKLRELFFANPGYTLGKPRRIDAQPRYPENQRWTESSVIFSALHVIGSNNGLSPWFTGPGLPGETPAQTAARVAEVQARNAANIKWLESTFQLATTQKSKGVVLFLQADLWSPVDRAAGAIFTAHNQFVERLYRLAKAYNGPVLIVSGDSHDYRVDAGVPWFSLYGVPPLPNVTQLIVDRSIEATTDATPVNWVKLTIDPNKAYPFSWSEVGVQ